MEDEGAEYLLAYAVIRSRKPPCYLLLSRPACRSAYSGYEKEKIMRDMGAKTFVFTDDLDINNRLYHQLCDPKAGGRVVKTYTLQNHRWLLASGNTEKQP